jgi:hypothetical protein
MKRNIILSAFFLVLVSGMGGLFYWNSNLSEEVSQQVEEAPLLPNSPEEEVAVVEYPLYMTTMTHMEIGHKDDEHEPGFWSHVDQLRYGMDMADEYEAILTIESEQPFARANTVWDHNMMKEIMDRGHGVGTHCDLGPKYTDNELSPLAFSRAFLENKALVDDLIGEENNHGCSGGNGVNDWVTAAEIAGFKYIDGIVARSLLPIPQENRPDPTWTDDYILENFHSPAPEGLENRIYLMKLKDLNDYEHDEDGGIVVSSGDMGTLASQADDGGFDDEAELTREDVDVFLEQVLEMEIIRDKTQVAKLNVYLPTSIFEAENEDALRYFFEETQKLQDSGVLQWASQREVVQVYLGEKEVKMEVLDDRTPRVDATVTEGSDLADVYTLFSLNVHDWVYGENSAESVGKVIDIHEQYQVPVDIYVTDPVFQNYVENHSDLVERLASSEMVAVSYHVRPATPYYHQFEDLAGLNEMDNIELYSTLQRYEEYRLDLETGLTLDEPGGYQFVKDTIGYAPFVTGVSVGGDIGAVLAMVYKDKGSQFVVDRTDPDLGKMKYEAYVRPEHSEVKLYEWTRSHVGGEDAFETAVDQMVEPGSGPQFINFKYHENNFYLQGTPFWPVYWEDDKKQVTKSPPFVVGVHEETPDFRPEYRQDEHWALYENTVKYASENAAEYNPINAFDLVEML